MCNQMRRLVAALLIGGLVFGTAPLGASQESTDSGPDESAQPPVPPCTTDTAPYRDFDFWIGSWEVFDPETGQKLGDNEVTLSEDGCLIVERWTSAGGGTGMSMNFHDPLQNAWRQVWQSAAGFIDYRGGLDEAGRMVLEGMIHYNARGTSQPFRGRWTPGEEGTVLQEFWQQDPESGEWRRWFSGEYRPK